MAFEKTSGIITIIIGLMFILLPMFSTGFISIIVGFSLLFFGISTIFLGSNIRPASPTVGMIEIIIGIIAVIFGFLFLLYIEAVPFIVGMQFYLVGFIMVIFGISGLLSGSTTFSKFTSILVLIMGIIAFALVIFAMAQPIYIAIANAMQAKYIFS